MRITDNLARYVKEKGFKISEMSRKTGISYDAIYNSLYKKDAKRELRAEELIKICLFIEKNPMDFSDYKQPA